MKELKFRQWQPETKRFLYIYQMQPGDTVRAEFILHDGELQQYTGLKDKNGEEIYEGDIIYDGVSKEVVKFNIPSIRVTYGHGECWYHCNITLFSNYGKGDHIEIIGNIYDNPEILK